MPKVTVFLTSYNHGPFIEKTIQSVLNQTFTDYEFYIVDDCSTDGSWEIIQSYAEKDDRIITVHHDHNIGGSRMKDLFDDFKGEYLAIIHSDDQWEDTKLEKQVSILDEQKNVAACFTKVTPIDDEEREITDPNISYSHVFEVENRSRFEWLNYFFYNGNCLCHPSVLIRIEAYRKYSLFTTGLHGLSDLCKWIRLCKGADIYVIQEKLTRFRVHDSGQNVSGYNPNSIKRVETEFILILQEYFSVVESDDFLRVFPEANKYVVDGEIVPYFAFSQLLLSESVPKSCYHLLGIQILYSLFQDPETLDKLQRLYGYGTKDFDQDRQRYDIFHVIDDRDYMQVNLYLDVGEGYEERHQKSTKVLAQPSGNFYLEMNIQDMMDEKFTGRIRLDLDEGRYRRFKDVSVRQDGIEMTVQMLNGEKNGEWDEFYTMDPQYMLEGGTKGDLVITGVTEVLPDAQVEQYFNRLRQGEKLFRK